MNESPTTVRALWKSRVLGVSNGLPGMNVVSMTAADYTRADVQNEFGRYIEHFYKHLSASSSIGYNEDYSDRAHREEFADIRYIMQCCQGSEIIQYAMGRAISFKISGINNHWSRYRDAAYVAKTVEVLQDVRDRSYYEGITSLEILTGDGQEKKTVPELCRLFPVSDLFQPSDSLRSRAEVFFLKWLEQLPVESFDPSDLSLVIKTLSYQQNSRKRQGRKWQKFF
jgi:hypothetical protein